MPRTVAWVLASPSTVRGIPAPTAVPAAAQLVDDTALTRSRGPASKMVEVTQPSEAPIWAPAATSLPDGLSEIAAGVQAPIHAPWAV